LAAGPDGLNVLARVRTCLAADLDVPGAVAAIDAWADGALAGDATDDEAPKLVATAVDALLGVAL
jgi:L-cysteine:1D-myo-inositol 2-amino-2-deoxy-alpha-D-glucopyranoside ligase